MSAYPPPVPQKVKPKPCSGPHFPSHLFRSTSETYPLVHESRIDVCDTILDPNFPSSLLHHFNNQCSILKDQDQQLMQLFMCIREEILLLQKLGTLYGNNPGKQSHYVQPFHNIPDKGSKIQSEHNIETVIKSYQFFKGHELECLHFDIFSHFDTSKMTKFIDEFRRNSDSNYGLGNLFAITSTKEKSVFENASNIRTLPPPVPEKKAKRDFFQECNQQLNSLNVTDDLSHSHSLIRDPVLNQGWPRSKSFNSNAFLNHTRKSSMTLSDFYDHLNPVSIGENMERDDCEQFKSSSSSRLPSLMLSTSFTIHKQPMLPTSKSNVDCKSDLDSSPRSKQYKHDILPSGLENFSDLNDLTNSSEIKDSRLIRAGSSPSLFSLSISPKLNVLNNARDLAKVPDSTQVAKEFNPSEDVKFQPIVSKSPKKLFSIISRGISGGFIKHSDKRQCQKYTQSSNDLSESFDLNPNLTQIENVTLKANTKINKGLSLLSPLAEIPPPVPPKFNKNNTQKSIDLQQTWC